jgi:DNA-binding NarL/FixJ family response regulator
MDQFLQDAPRLVKRRQALRERDLPRNSQLVNLRTDEAGAVVPAGLFSWNDLLAMRDIQVANLGAEGLSTKEIAKRLGITEHTVSNYLFRIYNKLGISSRVELVLYLMKQ